MDVIHSAIAWYQKKIGSYDKQLWEQSVEKKLQKSPPNVHTAPKKSVRLKTEYIDVDLIRGSTFSKTKPQVPWLYITRKAIARVVFFPFYYKWWVLQTSRKLYILLLGLYCLQVLTMIVYIWNFDDSITEDEVSLTVVILPLILMFLLCHVHSQTVLAHITHKPPKRNKRILEYVRKPKPKKTTSRKVRSSGNNSSACPEDSVPLDAPKPAKGGDEPIKPSSKSIHSPSLHYPCLDDPQQAPSSFRNQQISGSAVTNETSSPQISETNNQGESSRVVSLCDHDSPTENVRACSVLENNGVLSDPKSNENNVLRRRRQISRLKCDSNVPARVSEPSVDASDGIVLHSQMQVLSLSQQSSPQLLSRSPPSQQETKVGGCSFDLLDNLPEMRPGDKVYRDFCSQTDNSVLPETACNLGDHHSQAVSKEMSSSVLNERHEYHHTGTEENEKHPGKPVGAPSLMRETSGESAFSGHSDQHSSSEFEVVEENTHQAGDVHVDKSILHPTLSLTEKESPSASHLPPAPTCQQSQRGQSSPDSGISCLPSLTLSKTTVDTSHPSTCNHSGATSGDCTPYHCSQVKNSFSVKSQSSRPHVDPTSPESDGNDCEGTMIMSSLPNTKDISYQAQTSQNGTSELEHQSTVKCQSHSISPTDNSKAVADVSEAPQHSLDTQSPVSKLMLDSSGLQCFSEQLVKGILNVDTLREVSSSSLLANSAADNNSSMSDRSQLSIASTSSSSSLSASFDSAVPGPSQPPSNPSCPNWKSGSNMSSMSSEVSGISIAERRHFSGKILIDGHESQKNKILHMLDESSEQIVSDVERMSDGSNYNPSDSELDSDTAATARLRNRCEEKRVKRLRFQEQVSSSGGGVSPSKVSSSKLSASKGSTNISVSPSSNSQRSSFVDLLIRKPLPLKDLMLGRKTTPTSQTHSSGSDVGQSDTRTCLRRRRRTSGNQAESVDVGRSRSVPNSLGLHSQENPKPASSSENETGGAHTPEGSNKAAISSEEWEDRMQTDESTSSTYSSSAVNSDSEENEFGEEELDEEKTEYPISTLHVINLLQPPSGSRYSFQGEPLTPTKQQTGSSPTSGNMAQPDKVSSVIWEGNECKKVNLTALDIGWAIIDKVDSLPESSDYFLIGLLFSFIMALMPVMFRLYVNKDLVWLSELLTWSGLWSKLLNFMDWNQAYPWRQSLLMINGILQRFFLSLLFFFLLCVADRTFKQRLLYAKHFSYLTSSRRARKFSMPHFRLSKVRNIKIWLSLRSYLKRRGPQRSVDVIVSASFLCAIIIVSLISLQVLKDSDTYLDFLCNWELSVWFLALAVFLMRFMTLGLKINKKYRNLSVLITEQINLYLQMEQKPHKKEELILANNVLRLAEDLLKELESPFKISGFSANPLVYNITKVIVLSAFSAVLTEVLGFKLKLHKIKLKG